MNLSKCFDRMDMKRNHGLDTLRGIGILVVVLVHSGASGIMIRWALVFTIPLFYLVAGCLFHCHVSFREFAVRKFKRLIVPFIFFALAGMTLYGVGDCLLLHRRFDFHLFDIFSTDRYWLPYPASLWFFLSIFWCYIYYGLLRSYCRNDAVVAAVSLLIGAAGWALGFVAALPLSMDTAMSWLPMMCAGDMLKRYRAGRNLLDGRYWGAGIVVTAGCCLWYVAAGLNVGYCYNIFIGNLLLIMVLTYGATIGLLSVCCRVGKVPLLSLLGRDSLVIFASHQFFIIVMREVMEQSGVRPDGLAVDCLIASVAIGGSIVLGKLMRKYCPVLIGIASGRG